MINCLFMAVKKKALCAVVEILNQLENGPLESQGVL